MAQFKSYTNIEINTSMLVSEHEHKKAANNGKISTKTFRVALAGNPNAGKTSLFNMLTGQRQRVGNYPGVTVDKKSGYVIHDGIRIDFIDLPGTYSLSAYSLEEVVARDFVIDEKPDLIVDVLDSTNLERNLYLLLQLQELGLPVIGALNMSDEAKQAGLKIDVGKIELLLGIRFTTTVGNRGKGINKLLDMIVSFAKQEESYSVKKLHYGARIELEREMLIGKINKDKVFSKKYYTSWIAIKLLEGDKDAIHKVKAEHNDSVTVLDAAERSCENIKMQFNEDSSIVIGERRYAYIHGVTIQAVKKVSTTNDRIRNTEIIDRIVLNRYGGIFIFLGLMFLVYQFTFAIGNPLSDLVDSGFAFIGTWLTQVLPAGILRDLLIDGIIGGVGGVLIFFPIIMLLFLGMAFLEDTGYMARAAFVMDKVFQIFGLHGRSFMPFMIATGCAVPAVMSARTLSNKRDRAITIMVVPLMICGAKSPVIIMLAAAFFPGIAGTVFWLVWFASWIFSLVIALVLTKVMFKGQTAPFVLELPPYRMPTFRGVFNQMWGKSTAYVKKAGTIILGVSILIWCLLYFPKPDPAVLDQMVEKQYAIEIASATDGNNPTKANLRSKLELEYSIAGRVGKSLEGILSPAGFDWRIGIGLFAGFAAKEVIISTMGIVYGIGEADSDYEGIASKKTPLKQILAEDSAYSPAMALAMMVFVMIYLPCMSVLAVVKKELGSWFWPLFQAGYTLVVAWVLAVATYQVSVVFGLG